MSDEPIPAHLPPPARHVPWDGTERRRTPRPREEPVIRAHDVAELVEGVGRIALSFERIAAALEVIAQGDERRQAPKTEPLRAVYSEGVNQWGTAAHVGCPVCDSDIPVNSNGVGECRQCGYRYDPRRAPGTP